jgi:hypothetical protein
MRHREFHTLKIPLPHAQRYGGRVGRNIGAMKTWVSDAREQLFQSAQGGRAANPYPAILQDYLDHFLPHTPDGQPSGNKGSPLVCTSFSDPSPLFFSSTTSQEVPKASYIFRGKNYAAPLLNPYISDRQVVDPESP